MTAQELEDIGLVAIVRTDSDKHLLKVAGALARGGIRAMEITLTTPGALDAVMQVRQKMKQTLRVGAGTILNPEDAEAAMEAGAEFIVTPTLQVDTIAFCRDTRLPIICGCMTPTECLAAHQAGADFLKLFPADNLGPGYVRALRAPMPFLKFMPTGGVSLDNLAEFIRAGCVGVALGSNLVSRQILENEDWDGLAELAGQYMAALQNAREGLK